MIDLKYIKLPTIFSWSVCHVWVTLGLKNQDNLSFYLHFFYLKYKRSIFYNMRKSNDDTISTSFIK